MGKMKVCAMLNNKGGVGKTASITTLSDMLAHKGKRVWLSIWIPRGTHRACSIRHGFLQHVPQYLEWGMEKTRSSILWRTHSWIRSWISINASSGPTMIIWTSCHPI